MPRAISLDRATVAALERHETEAHAIGGRDIHDLGDGLLLVDQRDVDPFWNRLVSVSWPAEPAAFDRRLTEVLTLFGSLSRRPHVWPSALGDTPADLVDRLRANGFADTGRGLVMAQNEPGGARPIAADDLPAGVAIEVLGDHAPPDRVADAARVLVEGFAHHGETDAAVDDRDEADLAAATVIASADVAGSLADPRVAFVLIDVDGTPAAASKVTTSSGFAYLSSIATRPSFRGRGLGALATRAAVETGAQRGGRLAYLGVFEGNGVARRLYERLGFAVVGDPVPDLLLIG